MYQETKSEQRQENQRQNWLLDTLTQPRGRHRQHLFPIPIVSATGDRAAPSRPGAYVSSCWSLAQYPFDSFLPMI